MLLVLLVLLPLITCCVCGVLQVVRSPLSVEAGTLTRTMKPRRPAIQGVYKQEVQQLLSRLRG